MSRRAFLPRSTSSRKAALASEIANGVSIAMEVGWLVSEAQIDWVGLVGWRTSGGTDVIALIELLDREV